MLAQTSEPLDRPEQAVLFYVYCDDVAAFRSRASGGRRGGRPHHAAFLSTAR
jgi:hypothetical protein